MYSWIESGTIQHLKKDLDRNDHRNITLSLIIHELTPDYYRQIFDFHTEAGYNRLRKLWYDAEALAVWRDNGQYPKSGSLSHSNDIIRDFLLHSANAIAREAREQYDDLSFAADMQKIHQDWIRLEAAKLELTPHDSESDASYDSSSDSSFDD